MPLALVVTDQRGVVDVLRLLATRFVGIQREHRTLEQAVGVGAAGRAVALDDGHGACARGRVEVVEGHRRGLPAGDGELKLIPRCAVSVPIIDPLSVRRIRVVVDHNEAARRSSPTHSSFRSGCTFRQ